MADRPIRIQRRRAKGWRMPEGAVYVGRGSRWGNPYRVKLSIYGRWLVVAPVVEGSVVIDRFGDHNDAASLALDLFRERANRGGFAEKAKTQLRGRDLACWCSPGAPCHADVLLDLANVPAGEVAF